MVFKNLCVCVLWMKEALALEELILSAANAFLLLWLLADDWEIELYTSSPRVSGHRLVRQSA